jgi:hypothetical protein
VSTSTVDHFPYAFRNLGRIRDGVGFDKALKFGCILYARLSGNDAALNLQGEWGCAYVQCLSDASRIRISDLPHSHRNAAGELFSPIIRAWEERERSVTANAVPVVTIRFALSQLPYEIDARAASWSNEEQICKLLVKLRKSRRNLRGERGSDRKAIIRILASEVKTNREKTNLTNK